MKKTVVVTGASRGIGRSTALTFLENGYNVACLMRNPSKGPDSALNLKADITDSAALKNAYKEIFKTYGSLDIVIANAGITKDMLMARMKDSDFEDVINTNLIGSFKSAKEALPYMLKGKFGRIIFISSVVGLYGSAGQVNYAASKSGLIGMARSISREMASRNITSNLIAPGFIETDMTKDLPEDIKNKYLSVIPSGRFAKPAEVANVALFLASSSADYITGAVIPVDGGLGMGH